MKTYQEKILRGESGSSEDWMQYLTQAHDQSPSMSPKAFDAGRTSNGTNSYEELAAELKSVDGLHRVLDLACGDGHLITYVRKIAGKDLSISGVDMSNAEIDIARRTFPDASFKLGLAQSLDERAESFDAVLCHMVLMLMSPLKPVIDEVNRVLRPGGIFAGVVNGDGASGYLAKYAKELVSFTSLHFPEYKPSFAGDPRTRSVSGLNDILQEGGFKDISVRDISIERRGTPEQIASFFQDMYNVTLLPPLLKSEFLKRLELLAQEEVSADGTTSFILPLNLFSASRI